MDLMNGVEENREGVRRAFRETLLGSPHSELRDLLATAVAPEQKEQEEEKRQVAGETCQYSEHVLILGNQLRHCMAAGKLGASARAPVEITILTRVRVFTGEKHCWHPSSGLRPKPI